VKYFAGMLAIVALVAGATIGVYRFWDDATHTREDNGGVLADGGSVSTVPAAGQGQVIVTGTVTAAHIEGGTFGQLPMPITVATAERGQGGATITPVDVQGKSTSIEWTAGQPLPMSGNGGSLVLGPVAFDVAADAISLVLDGVHTVTPGDYKLTAPVAVGPTPKDSVTFTASAKTTVKFRGSASTPLPRPDLATGGTGKVTLEGALTVTRPDGSKTSATSLTLDNGPYTITLNPAPGGGYTLQATLQGPTH
jgi:hypothetical protein